MKKTFNLFLIYLFFPIISACCVDGTSTSNMQPESSVMERRAYVTIITTESEVEPAMAMLASLRAFTRTKYTMDLHEKNEIKTDYLCLILPQEVIKMYDDLKQLDIGLSYRSVLRLEWAGCEVKLLSYPMWNEWNEQDDENDKINWSSIDFNRLWIWSLMDYEKLVYIHHDMLILQDVTNLFDLEIWTDITSFAAAPSIPPDVFDTSIMVIKPDMSVFQEMVHFVKTGGRGSGDFDLKPTDDVDVILNQVFFKDWYTMSHNHRLRPIYNAPYDWTFNEKVWLKHRSDIKVFHFDDPKPWEIIADPSQNKVSKYGAPLIYVWSLLMFFITQPLVNLEEETRYVFTEVFDITKDSKDVSAYIARMKRGGTRRRTSLQDGNRHHEL